MRNTPLQIATWLLFASLILSCTTINPPPPAPPDQTPVRMALLLDKSISATRTRTVQPSPQVFATLITLLRLVGGELRVGFIGDQTNGVLIRLRIDAQPAKPSAPESATKSPFLRRRKENDYLKQLEEYEQRYQHWRTISEPRITAFLNDVTPLLAQKPRAKDSDVCVALSRAELFLNEEQPSLSQRFVVLISDGQDSTERACPPLSSGAKLIVVNGSGTLGSLSNLQPIRFESVEQAFESILAWGGPKDEYQDKFTLRDKRRVREICKHVFQVEYYRQLTETIRSRLQHLEANNPNFANSPMNGKVRYYIVVVGLLAIYIIDFLLLSPLVEFFVDTNFPGIPVAITAGRILIPASIMLMELLFLNQRLAVYEKAVEEDNDRAVWRSYCLLTLLSICLALAIPLAVISTFFAADLGLPTVSFSALMVTFLTLSLTGHVAIVFGGQLTIDSVSYILFALNRRWLVLKAERLTRRQHQLAQVIAVTLIGCKQDLSASETDTELLDETVRRYINEHFSDGVRNGPQEPALSAS